MAEAGNVNLEGCLARFGLSTFRPGQKEVIQTVLDGQDCLCIMPTGGGKSLCYQFPALMRNGVVLVVSPLIALMKDQVDGLRTLGLRATFINSSLEAYEQRERLQGMATGQYDLVYVAPERLRSPRFLEAIQSISIQLLAIDEAHCISEWGHDFRPDYARIGQFRERLKNPQTIALTATATPLVRRDVVAQLRLRSPATFVTGFERPNLRFEVHAPSSNREKEDLLVELLDGLPGAGIIYASTRKRCESIVELLSHRLRRPVAVYHAGLLPEQRRSVQDAFMSGQLPIMVATNAFGMGIDKRDLRFVIHYNIPGSLEAYYQEAGRAGRDGLPSRCLLLYSYADRYIQEFFIENKYPGRDAVQKVYDFLRRQPEDPIQLTQQQIKESLDLSLSAEGIGVCEQLLERCGVLERLDSQQNMAQVKLDSDLPTLVDLLPREAKVQRRVLKQLEREVEDRRREWVLFHPAKVAAAVDLDREALNRALRELMRLSVFDYVPPFRGRAIHMLQRDAAFQTLDIDFQELERRKAAEWDKLERVITYAQVRHCRQREILQYFGETKSFVCGVCDNCEPLGATRGTGDAAAVLPDDAVVTLVQIVLSGVARAKGRIGKNLLAKMLCGSQSAHVTKLNLQQLSTFGLLQDLNQYEVVELIEALLHAKLLEQTEHQPRRPIVQLTEMGAQVMRSQQALPTQLSISSSLAASLRRCAASRPRIDGADVGVKRPTSPQVSPWSTEEEETSVPFEAAEDLEDKSAGQRSAPGGSPAPAGPADRPRRPSWYWTWKLVEDGYSLAECEAIRGLERSILLKHLDQAAKEGLSVGWLSERASPPQEEERDDGEGESVGPRLEAGRKKAPGLGARP